MVIDELMNSTSEKEVDEVSTGHLINTVVKWFGVVVTAFTLFSNSHAIIEFSSFVRRLTDRWQELIGSLVNWILSFFNLSVEIPEATILFAVCSCLLVALSSQRSEKSNWTLSFRLIGWIVASAFSAAYFAFIILSATAIDPRFEDETAKNYLMACLISAVAVTPVFITADPKRHKILTIVGVIIMLLAVAFGFFVVAGVFPERDSMFEFAAIGVFSLVVISIYFLSHPVTVSLRSFSITVIILILLCVNLFSRFIEDVFGV